MLEARELLCERDERTLFSGLSFTLNAGEWVQITGSNGAGKTTLLRLLTGLSRPDAGEVLWQGQPLHQVRDSYHQNLLWIGHQPGIKTRLTALENLHFYHRDGDTAQCLEALAQAGLAGFEDIPVNQLSAGQQRRVALARLWLTRATLWIAIPVVVRTTENMLRLVPASLREAAFAIGAPRWRVSISITLRAVKAGVVTGVLLAIARVTGETAPLLFTALNNQFFSTNMSQPMGNLPVVIFQFAMSPYDNWISLAWGGALLIALLVLSINVGARVLFRSKDKI